MWWGAAASGGIRRPLVQGCARAGANRVGFWSCVPTGLVPTGLVPTVLVPTVLVPTGLVPTGLVPTVLVPRRRRPTTWVSISASSSVMYRIFAERPEEKRILKPATLARAFQGELDHSTSCTPLRWATTVLRASTRRQRRNTPVSYTHLRAHETD